MPTKTKRNNKKVIKKRRNTKKGGDLWKDLLGNWVYLTVAIQNSFNRLIEGFKSILNSLRMGVFAIYEYICFIITDIYKGWDSHIFVLIVIVLGVFSFGLAIPALSFSNIPSLCSILLGLWSVIITTFSVGGPALLSMIWTSGGLTGLSWLLITGASLFGIDLLSKWINDDLDDISEITKERELVDIIELIQKKSVELIALESEYDALFGTVNAPNKNERMRVIQTDIDNITVDIASSKKTQTELQTWLDDKYDEKRSQEKKDTALNMVNTIKQNIKDMKIKLKTLTVDTEIQALEHTISAENNRLDIASNKYMEAVKEVENRKASSKLKIHVTTRTEMMRLLDTLGGEENKVALMKYQIHVLQKMISDSDRTINKLVYNTKLDHNAPDESIIKELYAKYSYIEKSNTLQLELDKIELTEEEEKELNEIHKKLISIIKEPYTIETLHFYSDVEHEPQHTKLEPVTITKIKDLIVKNVSSVSIKNFNMSCPKGALSCLSHESIESLAKEYLQLEKKSRPDVEREFLHAKDIVEKQSFLRTISDEDKELILAKFRYNMLEKVSASADKKVEGLKGFTITSLDKIIGAIWSKTYIKIKLDGLKRIVEAEIDILTDVEQKGIDDSVEHLEENFPKDPTYLDYEKYQENGYIDEAIKKSTGSSDSIHDYELNAVKLCLKSATSKCSYITDDNREQMEAVLDELTEFKTDLGWRSRLYFGGVGGVGVKKPLSEKIHNLSTKKLLEMFNSIPKENIENLKQKNPVQFYIATVIGFIKETETGFEFSEEGIKGLKSVLKQSVDKVDKHCPKGKVCNTSMKNNEPKKKHNKSEKSTEVLTYEDTLELKGLLSSLEFVNMASMHSIVRENTNDIKTGGGSKGKKSKATNTTNTLGYLEKEDIEWLKEKHPKKYESAKKYGFVTNAGELAPICSKIIDDNSNINGIDINKEFEKGVSESQKDKIMNCILEDKQMNKEECRLFK